jgi:predicted ATPase/class 3 adenylate cyclase
MARLTEDAKRSRAVVRPARDIHHRSVRPDLPSGTVTFLFTDVEGSTKLLHELGKERYADALAEHRRLVREACARESGVEVDTQGDAFFFAFPTAAGAVRSASGIAAGLAAGPIRLRMGVHTGTPLVTDEGYVGSDVVRAARIAASGHGGQVLVSAGTEALLRGDSAGGLGLPLRDLGEHRFKDLLAPERVFQLGDDEFPPLRSLYRTNIPVAPTTFIGRERELAEVAQLIRAPGIRLLTLTGPGGTGKTRLAVQAAADASEAFPDGLWWVALAPLRDPGLLGSAVAQALGVDEEPGREVAETLAERLAGKQALLLLDNAEHLLPAIAPEIAWLRDVGGPTVVVTSRERLQLQGERVYAVPPLERADGVELFVARAAALGSPVSTSEPVAELAARLDDLPLALELAAARTVVFSPEQLLERLSQRLDLLKGGRDADPRQQTLRTTIEWSYDLLDEDERKLFRGFSVFAGCTYEAAEAVCDADPDTLQSLVDKSLLRRSEEGRRRYWMLETIREFAADELRAAGEDETLRRLHAQHYLAVARASRLAADEDGEQHHGLVIPERDNMRAALGWALRQDERELGLELAVALENYWATSGPHEGADWVDRLLDGAPDVPERLLARALRLRGGMENQIGKPERAAEFVARALDLARAAGDERNVAVLLHRLSHAAMARGDVAQVRALARESLGVHRRDRYARGEAQALTSLAYAAWADGEHEQALELLRESKSICERIGFRWWLSGVLTNTAGVALELEQLGEAKESAWQALALSQAMRDRRGVAYELSVLAEIAARGGRAHEAGLLWGAAEAERAEAPAGRWIHAWGPPNRPVPAAGEEFEAARATGRELSLDEVREVALAE